MFANHPAEEQQQQVLTVSNLNAKVRQLLEQGLAYVTVEGEISNFVRASSGHLYFSLKDQRAQVSCAMFRGATRSLKFTPQNGVKVQARARVTLYEPRGNYQLIIDSMEEGGLGALHQAFAALKAKLQAEGLFAEARKKPIPSAPKRIGVVTSPTGAAIRDILVTMQRRFPMAEVIIYPTLVQGQAATPAIVQAIQTAEQHNAVDVLIVGRGGGSLEDLWCFNEETVARALANCCLPTISAVGHEVDFTICDFVADLRAATPTAAAELVTPDQAKLLSRVHDLHSRMLYHLQQKLRSASQQLQWLEKRLRHPKQYLELLSQRLDELSNRLKQVLKLQLLQARNRFSSATRTLEAVSPLATLNRGYAIAMTADQKVIDNAKQVAVGAQIQVRLKTGHLDCEVRGQQAGDMNI